MGSGAAREGGMARRIGVVAIHGMGTFGVEKPERSDLPSYSSGLFERARQQFGEVDFDALVEWREAYYSHVFDKNQAKFVKATENLVSYGFLRDLAVSNLGDPASYHGGGGKNPKPVYKAVHDEIGKAFDRLRAKLEPQSPIVIVAHSLGGHVVSNYLYDLQFADPKAPGDVAAIMTIGCNLSLFLFGEDPKGITAISHPGSRLAPKFRPKTWWRNYFDRNDPLGFPIGPTGGDYSRMAKAGTLVDEQVDVGLPLLSMTALSHVAYWSDTDIAVRLANLLQTLRL
jgi:hypothetical protein